MSYRRSMTLLLAAMLLTVSSLSAEPHNRAAREDSRLDALVGRADLALSPILEAEGDRAESLLELTVINLAEGPVQIASRLLGADGEPFTEYTLALQGRRAVLDPAAKARLDNAEDLSFRLRAPQLPRGKYFLVVQVADPRTGVAATSTTPIQVVGDGEIQVQGTLPERDTRLARAR